MKQNSFFSKVISKAFCITQASCFVRAHKSRSTYRFFRQIFRPSFSLSPSPQPHLAAVGRNHLTGDRKGLAVNSCAHQGKEIKLTLKKKVQTPQLGLNAPTCIQNIITSATSVAMKSAYANRENIHLKLH